MISNINIIPNLEWYINISTENNISPRCPFTSVDKCPKYYQSISLLKSAGFTEIDNKKDKKLLKKWKKSPLWPIILEEFTSISGVPESQKCFSRFCPEVLFESFGLFVTQLIPYTDSIDRENVYKNYRKKNLHRDHWKCNWAHIEPQHYLHCQYYSSLLTIQNQNSGKEDIIDIKPNWFGIRLNFNALIRLFKKGKV